jgi:hypothetical protein
MLAFACFEERALIDHSLRTIKRLADEALAERSPVLDRIGAELAPPDPPERLVSANLLKHLHSVQSERAFRGKQDHYLHSDWFSDVDLTENSLPPTTFGKNQGRLPAHKEAPATSKTWCAQHTSGRCSAMSSSRATER